MITSYATLLSYATQAKLPSTATKSAKFTKKPPAEKALDQALAAPVDMGDRCEAYNHRLQLVVDDHKGCCLLRVEATERRKDVVCHRRSELQNQIKDREDRKEISE